ncbi:hypothetical protein [Megasphaera sp.]|nr:hypothetical protein [uncultured Megasphaera sp.]
MINNEICPTFNEFFRGISNINKADLLLHLSTVAKSLGLINLKGYYDDYTVELQCKTIEGATVFVSYKFMGPFTVSDISVSPRHHNTQELRDACSELSENGNTQVTIAKKRGVSQSRVSQVLKEN